MPAANIKNNSRKPGKKRTRTNLQEAFIYYLLTDTGVPGITDNLQVNCPEG